MLPCQLQLLSNGIIIKWIFINLCGYNHGIRGIPWLLLLRCSHSYSSFVLAACAFVFDKVIRWAFISRLANTSHGIPNQHVVIDQLSWSRTYIHTMHPHISAYSDESCIDSTHSSWWSTIGCMKLMRSIWTTHQSKNSGRVEEKVLFVWSWFDGFWWWLEWMVMPPRCLQLFVCVCCVLPSNSTWQPRFISASFLMLP